MLTPLLCVRRIIVYDPLLITLIFLIRSNLRHVSHTYISQAHDTVSTIPIPSVLHHYSIHFSSNLLSLSSPSKHFPLPDLAVPLNISFGYLLSPLFIILNLNWHHDLVVLFSITCLKQAIFIIVLYYISILFPLFTLTPLKHFVITSITSIIVFLLDLSLVPVLNLVHTVPLVFFVHQSCHYILYCHDLPLNIYIPSRNACCHDDTITLH